MSSVKKIRFLNFNHLLRRAIIFYTDNILTEQKLFTIDVEQSLQVRAIASDILLKAVSSTKNLKITHKNY